MEDAARPVVVVGAHSQSLLMRVDAIPRAGETVIGRDYEEPLDGGKATNQAAAAARFGAPVRFVSLVGNDARGASIVRYLDEAGVDVRWLRVRDRPTDVGFVMLPAGGIPAIATCQDLSLELDERWVDQVSDALVGASVVVCQLEAPEGCARAAFRLAREVGARTVLNPAPAIPVSDELLALTDVIVPNQHEAATMLGWDGPPDRLAALLARRLPRADVVVTAGVQGAYIAPSAGNPAHVVAPAVDVVDTTGAGDGLVGALAARLRDGDDLTSAVTLAVVAASLSVARAGTIPHYATLAEAQELAAGSAT